MKIMMLEYYSTLRKKIFMIFNINLCASHIETDVIFSSLLACQPKTSHVTLHVDGSIFCYCFALF